MSEGHQVATRARRPTVAAGTESATRVADVLLAFTSSRPTLGVTEIATQLGINKTTVHRILRSLASRDLIVFDPTRRAYRLGSGALALGAKALDDLELARAAQPILRWLQDQSHETSTVSALAGTRRVYLDQVLSPHEARISVEVGKASDLHAGCSSRAILAHLPPATRERILHGFHRRRTPNTITDPQRLEAELDRVVAEGVAISRGERALGEAGVAAPVFGPDRHVVGAVCLCGPHERFDDAHVRRLVPLVQTAADDLSGRLGLQGPSPRAERARSVGAGA